MSRNLTCVIGAASAAAMCLFGSAPALGDIVTISDINSEVTVDTGSASGMEDWVVDGVDHLFQQWFWYRVGDSGGEAPISDLTQTGIFTSDTNPFSDAAEDTLGVEYTGTGFEIELLYTVRGGNTASGTSTITEQIVIRNTGSTALDFHFFQYSDFDINGTAGGDTAEIVGGNTAQQSDADAFMSETVVTGMPDHFMVAEWPTILNSLNDGSPTTLGDDPGPVSGDMTWAFQWDQSIAPGQSFIISKDKQIVPAPGAMALLGLAALAGRRRRR